MAPFGLFARLLRSSSFALFLVFGLTAASQQDAPQVLPAETQIFRVGLKSIAIASPSKDLTEIGPDYRVTLETLAPATNRLVAAFTRPEDLHQILAGGDTPLPRYALVEVPRRAEFADIDPATFKTVADSVAKQLGTSLEADIKTAQDDFNHNLKELNSSSATIAIGKPFSLGTLFSKPNAAAFGMIASVSGRGPETKMAVAIVVLRVQSRVLYLYLYSIYNGETTVQGLLNTSEQWADAILKANAQ
jgi:hypothetical protein